MHCLFNMKIGINSRKILKERFEERLAFQNGVHSTDFPAGVHAELSSANITCAQTQFLG